MTPKKLLGQLAGHEPLSDERGGCAFCNGRPPPGHGGFTERYLTDHKPGCPWVKARRLLGDKLPAQRDWLKGVASRR